MKKMNKNSILAFYTARLRKGDSKRLAKLTKYSQSHICNVVVGRRAINEKIANKMYSISKNRKKLVA